MSDKTHKGNFFEDFRVGDELVHATPRTLTTGDAALYTSLYGSRFALHCSDEFARQLGYPQAPIDDLLVFHTVFGKSVPDISLNAVANLGYANGRFGVAVYPSDTISATSKVIGVKENSNGKTGTVYVRTVGTNQRGEMVLDFNRWVMVRKGNVDAPSPIPQVPQLPERVADEDLTSDGPIKVGSYSTRASGSSYAFEDYAVGERINHVDGITVEEAEHMSSARLYQNTARVHFNQHVEGAGRFGRRIVYGGHIISMARAASFNGLANAYRILGINAGTHANPVFAGDTVYAWSEVVETIELPNSKDVGAVRLRTVACKDHDPQDFPLRGESGRYAPHVVLDFDYTVAIPKAHVLEK